MQGEANNGPSTQVIRNTASTSNAIKAQTAEGVYETYYLGSN